MLRECAKILMLVVGLTLVSCTQVTLSQSQEKHIEALAVSVMHSGASASVFLTDIRNAWDTPNLHIYAYVLPHGNSIDSTSSESYGSKIGRLKRLSRKKLARILRAVVADDQLPKVDRVIVDARVLTNPGYLTLYSVSVSREQALTEDWRRMSLSRVMELWQEGRNDLSNVEFQSFP